MNPAEQLRLVPAQWVQLPDTDRQVLLHGKRLDAFGHDGLDIRRTGTGPPEWGGWDLTPVLGHCYIRRVRS